MVPLPRLFTQLFIDQCGVGIHCTPGHNPILSSFILWLTLLQPGHGGAFRLASMYLGHPPPFLEHFLTSWHSKVLLASLCFLGYSSGSVISPGSPGSSYWRIVLKTRTWVLVLLVATWCHDLQIFSVDMYVRTCLHSYSPPLSL